MKVIKNPNKNGKKDQPKPEKPVEPQDEIERKTIKDPETGLTFLSGPKITKEKVAKLFPTDSSRAAIILRRSVGLE